MITVKRFELEGRGGSYAPLEDGGDLYLFAFDDGEIRIATTITKDSQGSVTKEVE